MLLAWGLAALHLLALGIGLGAVWVRARTLKGSLDTAGVRRVIRADLLWGVAALLWISTGLWRAFGGVEKGTDYYLSNHIFLTKMALLVIIIAMEIVPARGIAKWRRQAARGEGVDTASAPRWATISTIQAGLIVLMVLAATAMARGIG